MFRLSSIHFSLFKIIFAVAHGCFGATNCKAWPIRRLRSMWRETDRQGEEIVKTKFYANNTMQAPKPSTGGTHKH